MDWLGRDKSVVVCAPTGSGKTVVAEYAVELALRMNKRCFYTTPLKALSNQKLHDLQVKYGQDKVGLLTGDISINREAPVVVMTTEVFRNMLYGTSFGDVNKNVRDVAFVILDECHYMNDTERGTVWEESIIYCPADIQLVALSATVANAGELTAWIDQTHGPTELVVSDFRPVPLRFYYFGNNRLFPLLNQGKGINPQLKNIFGSAHKRRGKSRRFRQEDVPDPRLVLIELAKKNMLPVIYFLFSRRGCEEAMKKSRHAGLVTIDEKAVLKKAVDELVSANPNLFHHPHLPYLYEGLSVHHAGMLPSWKAVVEKLFQKGLLKVVFATETLAAGINMPARTTIISAISKRSDDGHRALTASEFLQMSGRAGRRGMDEVGHAVVLSHPFESVEDAAKLAQAPADPLVSRFTPSYGMVLNLLQRHSMEEARDLIERSFGQYVINEALEPWFLQKMAWEQELDRLAEPLCPGELGDLPLYTKKMEAVSAKQKQLKAIERGLSGTKGGAGHGNPAGKKQGVYDKDVTGKSDSGDGTVALMVNQIEELAAQAHGMPCHGCPVKKPCGKQADRIASLTAKVKELDRRIERETTRNWRTFEALCNILRLSGYLMGDTPTKLGQMAAAIRGTNELFLSEVVLGGVIETLRPPEFAALATALISEDSRIENVSRVRVSPPVDLALERVHKIGRKLHRLQRDMDVDVLIEFSPTFCGLSQMWAEGATWEQVRQVTQFDEGDVVRTLRRTVDFLRQLCRAPHVPEKIMNLALETERLIARDEVRDDAS
jgi:superfamily II RNA helicase